MTAVDQLISRVQDVNLRLKKILSREKDISEKEKEESAELEQIKNLTNQFQKTGSQEIFEEDLKDFEQAVNLFEMIATELDETANDLQAVIQEIEKNCSDELNLVGKLASAEIQITDQEQIEEFTQSLNHTAENISKITREAQKAQEEAQKAQKEIETLQNVEKVIKNSEKSSNLQAPEQKIQDAKQKLQDAEWKLGEIPDKINEAKQLNQQTIETLEQNVEDPERRKAIKGAAAVGTAAVMGLAGCGKPKKEWLQKMYTDNVESYREKSQETRNLVMRADRDYSFQVFYRTEEPHRIEYLDVDLKWDTVQGWIKEDRRGIEFDIKYVIIELETSGKTSMSQVHSEKKNFESLLSLEEGASGDLFDDLRRSYDASILDGKTLNLKVIDIARREVDLRFKNSVEVAKNWKPDLHY